MRGTDMSREPYHLFRQQKRKHKKTGAPSDLLRHQQTKRHRSLRVKTDWPPDKKHAAPNATFSFSTSRDFLNCINKLQPPPLHDRHSKSANEKYFRYLQDLQAAAQYYLVNRHAIKKDATDVQLVYL